MELGAADFAVFFRAIHGYDPFPWQQALVDLLADGDEWPDVLDLPTGSGKTAALDAAVFHLALRFERPERAALRIALVVDRRLVVDDAYGRAKEIARVLKDPAQAKAPGRAVVAEVAGRLQRLAGDDEPPLVARRLRGGAPLESDWARTPAQPTILCSTVDQVGSRLLFRGYGVSNRMKPVHAGLFGKHTLILLDEAHLSEPFRATVQAVRDLGKADVRTVLLSATPGVAAARPHELTTADRAHPILRKRIEAPKQAHLHIESGSPVNAFAKAASGVAERLRQDGMSTPVVGVVVNRVGLAREIFEKLRERKGDDGSNAILLIGPSRSVERDRIVQKLDPFRTGSKSRTPATSTPEGGTVEDDRLTHLDEPEADRLPPSREASEQSNAGPLFVVATQCLEVGVDLDLDGLVTQAASFDALRQRFGRLNRAGRSVRAEGMILARADDVKKKADDAVYGDRIAKTWEALQRIACEGIVDFGIAALERRLEASEVDVTELAAPREKAPVAMPAYFDLWSQTSPPPAADPDVGLFLHGGGHRSAGVSFVWRGDITGEDLTNEIDLTPLLQLAPPRAAEMVEVPLWSVRAWLKQHRSDANLADVSDAPERVGDRETDETDKRGRPAFRWAGNGDPRTGLVSPNELRPGDVLVAPAEYGGCDEFGWRPASEKKHVTDVADDAARPFRKRQHAVRIARDVVASEDDERWNRLRAVLADDGASDDELIERLLDVLPSDDESNPLKRPRQIREPLEALKRAKGRIDRQFPYSGGRDGGAVLVAPHGLRQEIAAEESEAEPATEDDVLSHTAGKAVSVDDHAEHVVQRVTRFVGTLNLSEPVASDVKLAAFLHDAGKADRRFQNYLSGGDLWNRPDGPAMAKSGRRSPKGAWERAGLPDGWRHEALSVRLARAHPQFAEARDPALVLWLIGTHHGLGRPFFDFADPGEGDAGHEEPAACLEVDDWRLAHGPGPQSMAFDVDGADWAALYQQLRQRYGIWGLAHLEALLRLADHRASESEKHDD